MKKRTSKIETTFETIAERIKNSELTQKAKEEIWILARRGNEAVRNSLVELLDFTDRNPHVKEWLKSTAIVGVSLEIMPFSRVALMMVPGFVPGAIAGYLKGQKTDSCVQSAFIGGAVSWPVKPVLMISPIVGMLLVAFSAGILEETLAKSAAITENA